MANGQVMDLKRVGKFLLIGIVALVALIAVLVVLGVLGVPGAELEDNSWGEVDEERIEVITTITVDNPNPFGIGDDADVEYTVSLEDIQLAEGSGEDVGIDSGESQLEFRTDIRYQRIPAWWSAHLNNDEVSALAVDATVHTSVGPFSGSPSGTYEDEVDTDIEGALDEGFSEFEGEYSAANSGVRAPDGTAVEPTVEIENATTEWGEVTENRTEILLTLSIHNPNAYPIPTPGFTGKLAMNNITMADWDAGDVEVRNASDDATIPPGETEERVLVVVMDNQNVPPWFASHVEAEEYSFVEITGKLAFSVSGSTVEIPREGDGVRCTFDLHTSIFVEQDEGLERQGCGLTPLETSQEELEAAGATLDVTETDWWNNQTDDGPLSGGDDGDDGLIDDGNNQTDDGSDDGGLVDDGDNVTDDGDDGPLGGTDSGSDDSSNDGLLDGTAAAVRSR